MSIFSRKHKGECEYHCQHKCEKVCKHKWNLLETIKVVDRGQTDPVGRRLILQCENCGDMLIRGYNGDLIYK